MKLYHVSDVLSITTGRLVSNRHMDGVYDILNFMSGDQLFTHQLPRASRECEPWLKAQYPQLFEGQPTIDAAIRRLDALMADDDTKEQRSQKIDKWVLELAAELELPEMIPIYELGADMHMHIDPLEEARAMVGDDKVIVLGEGAA